ncbi:MAG: hypothetical protein ACREEY_13305 [Brevundimonas sp.]
MAMNNDEGQTVSLTALSELTGAPFFDLIMAKAPKVVTYRIAKAADHYNKAVLLRGADEEMGAIRLIAAEEELVIAIFKWLEQNPDDYPDVSLLLKKFKEHRVKLAFYPTLCQFVFALEDLADGVAPEGLNSHITWKPDLIADGGKVMVRLLNEEGGEIFRHNPLMINLNRGDLTPDQVVQSLMEQMRESVRGERGLDLKTYIMERAVFRDRLLYAYDDVPAYTMAETMDELLAVFNITLKRLLLTLAILVSDPPPSKDWGVLAQFLTLYHQVLAECGIGKVPTAALTRPPDTYEEIKFTGG